MVLYSVDFSISTSKVSDNNNMTEQTLIPQPARCYIMKSSHPSAKFNQAQL